MALVETKMKILEKLWEEGRPMNLNEVAQKTGFKVAATNMHLLGLKKTGYVFTPRHGYYVITPLGKEVFGLPKIDKIQAAKILGNVSTDKAFYFYRGIHQYTGVFANSLTDFCDKIQKIDVKSMEFHVQRKDFEQWIQSLGDVELNKRLGLIRNMHVHGEDLRTKVFEAVKRRIDELKKN
jgi:hypothetical protein